MRAQRRSNGRVGWVVLFAWVGVWDLVAAVSGGQTLSSSYADALARRRPVVLVLTAGLVCHLLRWPVWFTKVDPLAATMRRLRADG